MPNNPRAICATRRMPGSSLSGIMIASLPRKNSLNSSRQPFAPPLAFRLVANPLLRSVRKVEKYVGNRGGGRSGSMRFLRNPEGSTLRTPKNKAGQFCLAITLREAFPMLAPGNFRLRDSTVKPMSQASAQSNNECDLEAGCRVLTASPPMGTTEPGTAGAARTVQTGAVSRRPRQS